MMSALLFWVLLMVVLLLWGKDFSFGWTRRDACPVALRGARDSGGESSSQCKKHFRPAPNKGQNASGEAAKSARSAGGGKQGRVSQRAEGMTGSAQAGSGVSSAAEAEIPSLISREAINRGKEVK